MESRVINAVGVWFYSIATNRYLYLMRNDPKHPNTWGLPGGKCEAGETLMTTIRRECAEELGSMPEYIKLSPIEKFTSPDMKFCYHTFFCLIEKEFVPVLNHEHVGYSWIKNRIWPRPMHPGLWNTVNLHDVIQKMETIRKIQTSQCEINS
jgi:8-oxo-dGTP pyrophosphatase MutT (NUDIX family)